jgi:hypothetical protein
VERLSHAAHGREAVVTGELIRFGCRARGEVRRESSEWSPAHRRRGFLPGGTYLMATAHESQRPAISGDGPPATSKGGGVQDLLQLTGTVPLEAPIQLPDRASSCHIFSDFQMATHPVTYSKVVELYTIYNSTIGTELI